MKIPLDHPIWKKLHGAYGVRNVPSQLAALEHSWSPQKAKHLFWEELFHQGTLYPVTYAALPWLWDFAPRDTDTLYALSTIVACAQSDYERHETTRFSGLGVTQAAYDAVPFGPKVTYSDAEFEMLKALETWFAATQHEIAQTCFEAAKEMALSDQPRGTSAFTGLMEAHYSLKASNALPHIVEQFRDGETLEYMRENFLDYYADTAENTLRYLHELLPLLSRYDADLGAVITAFTHAEMQDRNLTPRDQSTPDLFQ